MPKTKSIKKQEKEAQIDFASIEKKWQNEWEKKKAFHTEDSSKKKKFYVLEMYPYPSASFLHMGHVRNYTIGDVYARLKRMQGFNVLYPMGYDSFGLPAETAAKKEGIHPKKYTEEAIKKIMAYQKALGNSYDWERTLASHDPDYYKWNQYFFIKLFEKGLAYRKKAPVNWCENCKSVLANEESEGGKCWRCGNEVITKNLEQWFLKITAYADKLLQDLDKIDWPEKIKIMQRNWIGKSHGATINFKIGGELWPIFTTRPDTIHGVTFMVVSALHPRLMEIVNTPNRKEVRAFVEKCKKVKSEEELENIDKEGVFTGSYAINPINGDSIPVWAGNFVLPDYGSGMVMAVPAHDQRDFEFAKKYKIPIIRVIAPNKPIRSYLMGAENISDKDLTNIEIKIVEKTPSGNRKIEIPKNRLQDYEKLIEEKLTKGFWNEYISDKIIFMFKHKNNRFERIVLSKETEEKIDKLAAEFVGENWNKSNVWKWLAENEFYTDLIIHTGPGTLINSGDFNGEENEKAKDLIINALKKIGQGQKTTNYKIRDWLVSRQRYWGTPIPMIYCNNCGIVPVQEKDLPVELPEKVDFSSPTPLASNSSFVNVKCPKCKGKASRETDTMGGFVDSSWYFLRYCDNKNKKAPFDKKKTEYWMPVDQYVGGAEHAVMHLMYARFFIKALKDLGFVNFDEPFSKLFNQGIVYKDGAKMSKSKGNVVFQTDISNKYGIDTARLFLMFVASPDKQMEWSDDGIEGSFRIINKLIRLKEKLTTAKPTEKEESKINQTIKKVTENLESFDYPKAIISILESIDYLSESISKKSYESILKLISPFCPHIAEELWHNIGNKSFISLESWPIADESKINLKLEQEEKAVEQLSNDINNIINIVKEKQGKEAKKAFIYCIPPELNNLKESIEQLQAKTHLEIQVFAVNDKSKHDPENKAGKAKPGKPALYLE